MIEKVVNQADGSVLVTARNLESGSKEDITCSRVVLAAGAIGTARIVLRSLGVYNKPLPILANPYTYYPCLVWAMLGKAVRNRRHSLTQLMIYFDHNHDKRNLLQAQIYSYRSLLTFKLMKEAPLAYRDSINLMRLIQSYFVIVGVHHEDRPGSNKTLRLLSDNEDNPTLKIDYHPTASELSKRLELEKKLMRFFPGLGCLPIKRIFPGEGSSIHYAGSLPMTNEDKPLTTRPDGALRDMENVYIADGAVFPHLPAKGLTFTLMANANRIGSLLADAMKA